MDSEGLAAKKTNIMSKTQDFAAALESLNTDDVKSMRKDFQDVLAMYKGDLQQVLGDASGAKKHFFLDLSSEGLASKKAAVISKTQRFAEALESLNAEDTTSMKADFEEVFEMYQSDLKAIAENDLETE